MQEKKKILVIEDSVPSAQLMVSFLEHEGFDVQVAKSVKEAFQKMDESRPDLILLDLNMPGLSGYDFLRMRHEREDETIPVIIVSAYDSHDSMHLSRELGAVEFIAKPVSFEILRKKIRQFIGI